MAYSYAQLEAMARSNGLAPEAAKVAAAIAMAESGGNPGAISSTGDYGLWQINARSWPQFDSRRLLEPAYNARAMATIYKGSGWTPWATYKNGRYRSFIPSSSSTAPTSSSSSSSGGLTDLGGTIAGALGGIPGAGLAGDVAGSLLPGSLNPAQWAGALAQQITADVGKVLLGLLIGSAGVALAAYGVVRLTSESQLGEDVTKLAQTAGTVATVAAL